MFVLAKTRVAVPSRWIRAAVAALVLASGATLLAQENKDKEKKPAPAHKNTPPPKVTEPSNRPSNNAPPPRGENTPAVHPPDGRPPAANDRPRPNAPAERPGAVANRSPAGGVRPVYHGPNGAEVHYAASGRPETVKAHGYTIVHGPTGVARTEFVRPDHSVIVTHGSRYGYVQRNYVVGGATYVQRTYVIGGVSRAYVYRPYTYHGIALNVYVAPRYYAPAFYGWAYNPWPRPVVFSFGWGGAPWYGYYAGYFTPYPTYAGPAFWLTDYMMAMTLQAAYDQQMAAAAAQAQANAAYAAQPALTPQVKQAIADEVQRQLNEERAQSQTMSPAGAPDFLTDNSSHIFVVSTGMNVQSSYGQCALTEGDVLQLPASPPPNSVTANVVVLASKGQDCGKGSGVSVDIADLQEMQNHMRETLDQGLADLQSHQGQNGIPPEPVAAQAPPTPAPYAAAAPPPDPNIAAEVSQQAQAASQAENEALQQAQSGPSAAGGAPGSVSLGMSIDQVTQLLGQPQMVGDLGSKKIYSYGNMKVIFVDGKVSDIQ